jgi:hypothetical protein
MADFNFNGWIDSPEWVKPGEPVKAEVVNRAPKQIFEDVNILASNLYRHITNYDNPHRVSLEQLGFDTDSSAGNLSDLIAQVVNDIAGSFVAEGLDVELHEVRDDLGYVEVLVKAGRAYREGEPIEYDSGQLIRIPMNKFYFPIVGELKTFKPITTPNDRFYATSEQPLRRTTEVVVDMVVTEQVTRGSTPGGSDELAHEPVRKILKVWQGDTVYQEGVDYQLNSNAVDWSLGGSEPDPGSTYYVTYVYGKNLTKGEEYWDGSPLKAGDTVRVFVAAVDNDGKESDYSDTVVAEDKVVADGRWYKIYWNSVPGAVKYRVYASINGDQFSFVGETTSTSIDWYGARDTSQTPQGGGSLPAAEISNLDDQVPAGIVLNEPNGADERWLTSTDGYPGLVILNYEYYVPNWAILQIGKNGLELVWGDIDSKGNPSTPEPTKGSVPLAKFWVPALDSSQFRIYDIKAKPPKAKLLQSILERLDTLEDEVIRIEMVTNILNTDTNPKKGIYADPLTKPDHIDIFREDFSADWTGDRVVNKKINEAKTDLDDPSRVELTSGAKVWTPEEGSDLVTLALANQETVYQMNTYTRTIDLVSAMANTEDATPFLHVFPETIHQGGWIYVRIGNFEPSSEVTITLGGVELGTITTDIYGSGAKWFRVPDNYIDESLGKRILNAASAQVRTLAQSIYSVLKTAERSLWPIRYTTTSKVIARWTNVWNRSWGWCQWWRCGRTSQTIVQRNTAVYYTRTAWATRLGLQEQDLGNVNLGTFINSAVKAEDQTGKHAVKNVHITTGPVKVPLRAPKLTKDTYVAGRWSWITIYRRTTIYTRTVWWRRWWDPVAESFTVPKDMQITSVGVRLSDIPDDPENNVRVIIGRMEDGVPGRHIWEKEFTNAWVKSHASADGWVWFPLDAPLYLKKGEKIFVAFGATKPGYRAYIAKVGDIIPGTQNKLEVKVNPNQVFFTSSNAESWTAEQDTNLCFGIKCGVFKGESDVSTMFKGNAVEATIIDFPEVALPAGATAVAVHADQIETPDGTGVGWFIGIPGDNNTWKWIPVEKDRETPLGANVTSVRVRAVLKTSNPNLTPALGFKNVAISHFAYENNSTLVTTMFELSNDTATTADIKVRAIIPEGQTMKVYLSADDGQTWIDAGEPLTVTDIDLNEGLREYEYQVSLPDDDTNQGKYRLKIQMTCDGIVPSEIDEISMILR